MNNPYLQSTKQVCDFLFRYECRCYGDAYVVALRILKEPPKDQWTTADVLEAVRRASSTAT